MSHLQKTRVVRFPEASKSYLLVYRLNPYIPTQTQGPDLDLPIKTNVSGSSSVSGKKRRLKIPSKSMHTNTHNQTHAKSREVSLNQQGYDWRSGGRKKKKKKTQLQKYFHPHKQSVSKFFSTAPSSSVYSMETAVVMETISLKH